MKKVIFAALAIFAASISTAQDFKIAKGAVTDSLPVPGVNGATYSVYLPSDYNPEKKWPVIFIFDPEGRGRTTANLIRSAAEEQGYLIASSNIHLKSQPIDSIIKKATSMINGFVSTFPVDTRLAYAAGMSEGAQVASAMPLIYNGMAGILAIGNSFLNTEYITKKNPYMFIGLGGTKDYMIYKMEEYLSYYDKLDFPTEVYYFDGKQDQWPETKMMYNAIGGFSLQAMRSGLRNKDDELIKKLYDTEIAYIESLRRTRNYYDAFEHLERMEEKYEDFGFEDDLKDRMKSIKRTDGFKAQRREFREIVAFEKQQQAEYEYLLSNDIATANFQNIGWWAFQVDELNKLKEKHRGLRGDLAYRLHSYIDLLSERKFKSVINSEAEIDIKIFISVLRTAIKKDDPEAYLKIVSLAGSDGDFETALLYLEDLLKTGYSDMDAIYEVEGALDLKLSKEFNELIKKYLGESKYYNEIEPNEG
ncbi:hypothetical protein [Christiangramia salexigens]|uniref:Alpha/beta hydrolase n=1 Tax=Christiangramia salexigens TaxID=1913577 RepID=A0A1L3J4V3_9FLAO|nr:hypothetical protein [Christiangramia salexigens]APG60167.1 hypothetical protein LPB144_06955 [Christiangramia salexigens]